LLAFWPGVAEWRTLTESGGRHFLTAPEGDIRKRFAWSMYKNSPARA
jgi:hypothetical protein